MLEEFTSMKCTVLSVYIVNTFNAWSLPTCTERFLISNRNKMTINSFTFYVVWNAIRYYVCERTPPSTTTVPPVGPKYSNMLLITFLTGRCDVYNVTTQKKKKTRVIHFSACTFLELRHLKHRSNRNNKKELKMLFSTLSVKKRS